MPGETATFKFGFKMEAPPALRSDLARGSQLGFLKLHMELCRLPCGE